MMRLPGLVLGALLLLWPLAALAAGSDPITPVLLGVTAILFFAVIGRHAALKLGAPSVLGELLMGMLLGNLGYYLGVEQILVLREGSGVFEMIELSFRGEPLAQAAIERFGAHGDELLHILQGPNGVALLQVAHAVDIFSRYGVIFLLFLVGLETSLEEMRRVGAASARVAVIGVVLPFVLGFAVARALMPEASINTDLFVAAALGATSVGITARVLRELGALQRREAKVILGAAVIDDILGLILLAIVSGIVVSGRFNATDLVRIVLLALLFLWAAIRLGPYLLRWLVSLVHRLDIVEAKMLVSFLFVMALSWAASLVGLATIVGAFAAGVILHEGYFAHWNARDRRALTVKELVMPLEVILVPIFFVLMGLQVKLEALLQPDALMLAAALTVAAILGKLFAGMGAGREGGWLAIGLGMLPRGEVGLIFASLGHSLGVIDDTLFSAIVMMVIVTTLLAPPLLKWRLKTTTPVRQ